LTLDTEQLGKVGLKRGLINVSRLENNLLPILASIFLERTGEVFEAFCHGDIFRIAWTCFLRRKLLDNELCVKRRVLEPGRLHAEMSQQPFALSLVSEV